MSLGELKGMYLHDQKEKDDFYNLLLNQDNVEEIFDYGNFGFCLKVKNPVYKFSFSFGGLIHPVIS